MKWRDSSCRRFRAPQTTGIQSDSFYQATFSLLRLFHLREQTAHNVAVHSVALTDVIVVEHDPRCDASAVVVFLELSDDSVVHVHDADQSENVTTASRSWGRERASAAHARPSRHRLRFRRGGCAVTRRIRRVRGRRERSQRPARRQSSAPEIAPRRQRHRGARLRQHRSLSRACR